jgi:hypothetical protein
VQNLRPLLQQALPDPLRESVPAAARLYESQPLVRGLQEELWHGPNAEEVDYLAIGGPDAFLLEDEAIAIFAKVAALDPRGGSFYA